MTRSATGPALPTRPANETTWTCDRLSRMTEARNAMDQARTFVNDSLSNKRGKVPRHFLRGIGQGG